MCFGGSSGPSAAEQEAARAQRAAADAEAERVRQETAAKKREDVAAAISGMTINAAKGSKGAGRRSLFQSSGKGSGFLGRFD